jgi:uncharacterized protein (DUF2267 family)
MNYDEFVTNVRRRADLTDADETVRAISATLSTLGGRLARDEADDLAAQLPARIGRYLGSGADDKPFSLDEFFARVSAAEGADLPLAIRHARAVMSVVMEAISLGEIADLLAQLPPDYGPLFGGGDETLAA